MLIQFSRQIRWEDNETVHAQIIFLCQCTIWICFHYKCWNICFNGCLLHCLCPRSIFGFKTILFVFQTVQHGFPNKPSAVAFDPQLKLMAIGTKNGVVKVYPLFCINFQSTKLPRVLFIWLSKKNILVSNYNACEINP